MLVRHQRLPISDGAIVATLKTGLTSRGWGSGLTVRTKLPKGDAADPLTRRMVTVRDDSGPLNGRVQSRSQGINVWADSSVDALNLALDALAVCQGDLVDGALIVAASQFSGPYEVPVEAAFVVGGKPLTNYYFAFVADVKAS